MREFTIEPWYDGSKCRMYTVRFLDMALSETDKFFVNFNADPKLKESSYLLANFIVDVICEKYGAIDALFNRYENEVVGLPNKGQFKVYHFPNFPLRLYALKISSEIVVLFTGGKKDHRTNQTSNVSSSWYLSIQFAKAITKAISDGSVVVNY